MKKILLKRRASLGDVLNTTPVARRLRQENPDARIYVETLHGIAYLKNPYINEWIREFPPEVFSSLDIDQVIDLNMCFESNRRIHQVDANMIRAFGDSNGNKTITLVHALVDLELPWEKVVVVHPNRTWSQRTIPFSFWEETISLLIEADFVPVITGTSQDWRPSYGLNLQDKLSLAQQANLLDRARCFLTGASGLITVAGATETPVVPLLSMTPGENFLPYRHDEIGWNMYPINAKVACFGCDVNEPPSEYYECRRTDFKDECITTFVPEEVVEQVRRAIREDKRSQIVS